MYYVEGKYRGQEQTENRATSSSAAQWVHKKNWPDQQQEAELASCQCYVNVNLWLNYVAPLSSQS